MQNFLQKAQTGLHKNIPNEFITDMAERIGDDWAMDDMEFRQAAVAPQIK